MKRQQKSTFAKMRAAGVRNVLIYCSDHRCGHFNIVPDDADRWPDELRISDIEDKFVCTACGKRGADIRPDWQSAEQVFSPGQASKTPTSTRLLSGAERNCYPQSEPFGS